MMKVCQRKKIIFIAVSVYLDIIKLYFLLPDRQDDIQVINHLGAEFISNVKYIKEDRNKGYRKKMK